MPRNWKRLNRAESVAILEKLGDQRDALVFSMTTTDVTIRDLTFYSRYKLYRLVNYATLPVFSMMYLSDGKEFIQLDGTAGPIYTANEKDPIRMDETTIIPYLEFFFAQVEGSEGDVFLIKNPRKAPFMESLSEEQQNRVVDMFKPIEVSRRDDDTILTGTIYYGGGLIAATIVVAPDGKMAFEAQSLLLNGIHFPPSPYGHMWLEG
ncbi:MAG: hypothetical protein OXT65_01430 [Alphaproteobacteria bacterium]|nr:hypothetical protein [Alphaproteobacteria bacterium]